MRRVVSVWFPHWPMERLARAHPANWPADVPFALVLTAERGLLVGAVNGKARSGGIHPGMGLADARAILPALLSRPAEPDADARALKQLALWCGRYGPSLAVDGPGGMWIDITGVAHLFGGEAGLLRDLVRRLSAFGITVRPGLADTLGAASAIARYASGRSISGRIAPPGGTGTAIAELPVEALRLDAGTVRLLDRLGLKRIGQLYDIPRASLARRFSSRDLAEAVLTRLDQALGLRAEPGRPLLPPPSFSARVSFPEPIISGEALEAALANLARTLAGDLGRAEQGARRLALALYRSDGTRAVARLGLSRASTAGDHMLRLFREKLAAIDAGYGIDVMVLAARAVEPLRASQSDLEHGAAPADGGPAQLLDRLASRLGPHCVLRLVPRQSHIPERAQAILSALEPSQPWPVRAPVGSPRPPFLLERPEPIDVLAEVPEGPPQHFRWRRNLKRVVRSEGPERIEPEWWREIGILPQGSKADEPQPPKTSCARDYYRIEDETGARYWVFREGLYRDNEADHPPAWYMHGLFG